MFYTNWLDMNCGPLVSEAATTTESTSSRSIREHVFILILLLVKRLTFRSSVLSKRAKCGQTLTQRVPQNQPEGSFRLVTVCCKFTVSCVNAVI